MAPVVKAHRCSPGRISLAWRLAKPVVTSVVIGAKRLDQLQDNLAAIELTLTQDELMPLDDVSALPQSALYLRPVKPVGVLQRTDLRRAAGRVRRRVHRTHAAQQFPPESRATPEAEEAWREHVAELVGATLFPRAQSWYMGANIPGKKREMLVYPGGLPMYLQKCKESADAGYAGYVLS
jgi:hypothetical protein